MVRGPYCGLACQREAVLWAKNIKFLKKLVLLVDLVGKSGKFSHIWVIEWSNSHAYANRRIRTRT